MTKQTYLKWPRMNKTNIERRLFLKMFSLIFVFPLVRVIAPNITTKTDIKYQNYSYKIVNWFDDKGRIVLKEKVCKKLK